MADEPHGTGDGIAVMVAVLAAGRAARFGGGKLGASCAGKPLGRWALDAVAMAGLTPGMIVTGPDGAPWADGWRRIANPHPEQGIGSSLAIAARAALDRDAASLMVLLADMPLIDPAYLRRLASANAPAATRHPGGKAGVPALLDAVLMRRAATLSGDEGAGRFLTHAAMLDAPPGTLTDVDTPDQLRAVAGLLPGA